MLCDATFRKNDMLIFPGTKADLWNTVSPKMAQRVFSEMLNESLSIITTRFIHVRPRDISRLVPINLPIYFVFFYLHRMFYRYRELQARVLHSNECKVGFYTISVLSHVLLFAYIMHSSTIYWSAMFRCIVCMSNWDGN